MSILLNHWSGLLVIIIGVFFSLLAKKLTIPAALAGGAIAIFIYAGVGYTGIVMLGIFFLLGSYATSFKIKLKEGLGFAEQNKGRRSAGQVIANAGVAGFLGFLATVFPEKESLLRLMIAASFSAATADTLSSELGMIYGKKFYNIRTLKTDRKGLNGVVSPEGTLLGLLGSIIIALVYAVVYGWDINLLWIIISGTAGNLLDSLLGATLERSHYLNNNAVNILNTLMASLVLLLCVSFHQ
jgi:uncharacterized protein (TIGR00297 family)